MSEPGRVLPTGATLAPAASARQVRFSVLIPLHRDGPDFRRCLAACMDLEGDGVEIVVVSDAPVAGLPSGVVSVVSGAASDTSPAEKRDLGLVHAHGDILAFLDDDAFPARTWLTAAAAAFADDAIAAAGGPGVTPPGSAWRELVGGSVYESPFGSGPLRFRFWPLPARDVDDHPAFNLLVRRDALEQVGGWGTGFYGGEDTVLCLKLASAGMRVRYEPEILVFHRRRPVLRPHLRQIANVGRHRGYFVRRYPDTSRRGLYFLPALMPAVIAAIAVAAWYRPIPVVGIVLTGYGVVVVETLRRAPLRVALVTPAAIVAHHLAYGIAFARGSLGKPLSR